MNVIEQLSHAGRQAVVARDWATVDHCATEIGRRNARHPEGPFLKGLAEKAAGRIDAAAASFAKVIDLDERRYDAAIELAFAYVLMNRHAEAADLVERYEERLANSPVYLQMAGRALVRLGLYEQAWPLFEKAIRLQPEVESFQADMANCAVYLGKIGTAADLYRKLLRRNPAHQRNHYELAQLKRAEDDSHVRQMLDVLEKSHPDPKRNIFLYYALGKELEDLERWDEAFRFYKKGGDAARSTMTDYEVAQDVATIDSIIGAHTAEWLAAADETPETEPTPIFVVGLPRTGTTLVERVITAHSGVESIGETQVLHMLVRRLSGIESGGELTPAVIEAAAPKIDAGLASDYVSAVKYRLGGRPMFVEKLPENVLHLGAIAKAWPNARLVHVRRHPMDACFAMYKQSYFRFAYTLEDLEKYYLAYDRLTRHWQSVLGSRVTEVEYERLVTDFEQEVRRLLDGLGLEFEEACLEFERSRDPVATASAAQVREPVHRRSVGRWRNFERQLEPLRLALDSAGVPL